MLLLLSGYLLCAVRAGLLCCRPAVPASAFGGSARSAAARLRPRSTIGHRACLPRCRLRTLLQR